jgi:hypothetical protein
MNYDLEINNEKLDRAAIQPTPVPADYACEKCAERGWVPRVWQEDCPECWGGDEYGQAMYCAECEFCCGC